MTCGMNTTLGVAHQVYVFPLLTLECHLKYYISNTKTVPNCQWHGACLGSIQCATLSRNRVGLVGEPSVSNARFRPVVTLKCGNKMMVMRKNLVVLLAVVVLSAGATLTQAQRRSYRGTFRSVRQLILRIENRTDVFRNSLD